MENEKKGRGRPKLPRDEFGNIIRPTQNQDITTLDEMPEALSRSDTPKRKIPVADIRDGAEEYYFGSVAEFIQSAREIEPIKQNKQWNMDSKTCRHGPAWFGLPTHTDFNQMEALINSGWQDGVNRLQSLTDGIDIPPVKSTRRKARWSDNGCEVEMQRVWGGQFDQAFRRTSRESAKAPSKIRIVCENAVTGGTDADSAFWTGAACVALADILSQAGHNVEIVNILNLTNKSQRLRAWLVIKESQTPMSAASVAGTTALIGFFRCIGLAWFTGMYKEDCGSGMGMCENITLKHVSRPDVGHTYLASYAEVLSQDGARKWIEAALLDFA